LISTEIEFFTPEVVSDVLALLAEYEYDITVLSGGMSLMPMMNLGLATPERVVSLNRVDSLASVIEDGADLVIGARVRHAQVATDPLILRHCPALAAAARRIGDVQVRNRGTIGGSVSHADPSADYLPALVASGGTVVLQSAADGERRVAAPDFFIDLMFTAREPTELVTAIRVPKLPAGYGSAYIRFARVEGSFAIVNAAAVLSGDGSAATLGLGGIGPRPVALDIAAHGRSGWDDAAVEAVGDAAFEASAAASSDTMSDAEYKREMARVHARRVVRAAAAQIAGAAL
jgi:aerobic carbon-monoxide dehydrogenase medium subunit